jgi:hypothetical protein
LVELPLSLQFSIKYELLIAELSFFAGNKNVGFEMSRMPIKERITATKCASVSFSLNRIRDKKAVMTMLVCRKVTTLDGDVIMKAK